MLHRELLLSSSDGNEEEKGWNSTTYCYCVTIVKGTENEESGGWISDNLRQCSRQNASSPPNQNWKLRGSGNADKDTSIWSSTNYWWRWRPHLMIHASCCTCSCCQSSHSLEQSPKTRPTRQGNHRTRSWNYCTCRETVSRTWFRHLSFMYHFLLQLLLQLKFTMTMKTMKVLLEVVR